MSRSLLVTGGAGYIGSHMVKQLLASGHRVVVYDSLDRGNRDAVPDDCLVIGTLDDRAALNALFSRHRFDAVLHFAALAYVGESVEAPLDYYRNNVGGSLELLETMQSHAVRRLVFSSTCATYGIPDTLPIIESTAQRPINPYGRSKLMVEAILEDLATAHALDSVSLRYFNAVGAASDGSLGERHLPETHLLPLILFEALRVSRGGDPSESRLRVFGGELPTRDGTCIRDYIHVEDLCTAHEKALDFLIANPDCGARKYNLGANRGYTVLEVIDACRRMTGMDIRYQTVEPRAGDPPELVADAHLAERELGWQATMPDIESAIAHAWAWFRQHPPLST